MNIFQCPKCKGNLVKKDKKYVCVNCGFEYPIIDDIIYFKQKD